MDIRTTNLKGTKEFNGETILDLQEPTLIIDDNSASFIVSKLIVVNEQYVMRPDLISFAVYGSTDHVDLILKANNISNPFSIDIGDVLIILDKNAAQKFYRSPKKPKAAIDVTKELFLNPDRASKKDIARIKNLQKQALKKSNGASEVKPTNLKRAGENAFTFGGGSIQLSAHKSKKS